MSIRNRVVQPRFASLREEAMVALLVASAHLQRELDLVCGVHGITPEQYNVLRILRGGPREGYPRYEIARRLIDRAPDVTRLLDRLVRVRLVERGRAEGDRRVSLSRITPAGLTVLSRLDPAVLALHERFAGALGDGEARRLAALCGQLIPAESAEEAT